MSFIYLTTSQQLRCSQPFKIRSRKSICKIKAVWFRSCFFPVPTSWNQSLVLFLGLLMRPLRIAQQSKISRNSRSWQNVIALVCSPSLALLANNYEFLSCRFFVGLLMRAMGLSVCVNGFRKFMQLAPHHQDKQPTLSQAPIHPRNYQYPLVRLLRLVYRATTL